MWRVQVRREKKEGHSNRDTQEAYKCVSFFEHYTMSEYALRASVSKPTMERLFKKYLGVSPQEYLIKVRIETAMVIIRESNNSFLEISRRVGYRNLYHFSSSFRKVTGMTPTRYRQSLRNEKA